MVANECLLVSDSYIYSVRRAKDKPTTSPATPSSPANIPSTSPASKLDESTVCPSRCVRINSSHGSAGGTNNSLLRHNNINRMPCSRSRVASAAWHYNNRDPFTGFCQCRDLGALRVCQRCPRQKTSS